MKVFLDDERFPTFIGEKNEDWVIVRTAKECIELLMTNKVTHISLDNDLGDVSEVFPSTGYDVACWIEEQAYFGTLSRLLWNVHSMNSVENKRIPIALTNADKYWTTNKKQ